MSISGRFCLTRDHHPFEPHTLTVLSGRLESVTLFDVTLWLTGGFFLLFLSKLHAVEGKTVGGRGDATALMLRFAWCLRCSWSLLGQFQIIPYDRYEEFARRGVAHLPRRHGMESKISKEYINVQQEWANRAPGMSSTIFYGVSRGRSMVWYRCGSTSGDGDHLTSSSTLCCYKSSIKYKGQTLIAANYVYMNRD